MEYNYYEFLEKILKDMERFNKKCFYKPIYFPLSIQNIKNVLLNMTIEQAETIIIV